MPRFCVLGIKTNCSGAISKVVRTSPDLAVVNPRYLGVESTGSSASNPLEIVIVAIPSPSVTIPVTLTPGPTKFNWVMDPIPALPPIILPSSLTVIPSSI
jgi:hypothetical protein